MSIATILYWDHPWSAVSETARVLSQAFASLGVDVRPLNVMDVHLRVKESELSEFLSDAEILNCDIAISLGAPPLSIQVGNQWLFEVLGQSFYLLSMDALYYDFNRVRGVAEFLDQAKISPRLGVIAPDRDACDIISDITFRPAYPMRPAGYFVPLSGAIRLERVAVVASMGWELADIPEGISFEELVFQVPPVLVGHERLAEFACAIESPGPIENISKLAISEFGITPEDVFTHEFVWYLSRLDAFQKRRRRIQTVAALSGVPIDFFGPNWEPITAGFKDCRYLGSVSTDQVASLCQRYRVLLDFNPGFGHSLHDRVYTGIGNGCRVMTNANRAIPDHDWPGDEAIMPYEVGKSDLADLALHALALPPMEPSSLLGFRSANSALARVDEFLLSASNPCLGP